MNDALFKNSYWLLFVLLLIYQLSLLLKKRFHYALINPTLITTVLFVLYLLATKTPYEDFEKASIAITFWLQPAVVCLAVPLYVEWQKIKAQWLAIVLSQLVASVVGIVSGVWLVLLFGGSPQAVLSVAAKSVTLPIAIGVTQNVGGVVGINAATVLTAGVTGQVVGLWLFQYIKLKNPMSQGLAMGTASHALGIAAIMPYGLRFAAYGTVGLIVNGIFTACIAPFLVPFLL